MINDAERERSSDAERERQYEVARQQRIEKKKKPRSWAGMIVFGLLLFFAFGVVAVVALLRNAASSDGLGSRLASSVLGRPIGFDTPAPVVVERIQQLNRLESVSYSVDTVVEGKRTNAVLPDLLFGDRLLLVVHGQVVAGVDMSKLKPSMVQVTGKSVMLELPRSEIFTTRIEESKSKVFARTTGILVPTDPNLETDTRRQAETQIQQAALNDGILDTARSNARMSVESLLRGLGFEQVTVR